MVTKLIGLKEYRSNLTKFWKDALDRDIRYVVMVRSRPVFEVRPIRSDEFSEDAFPVFKPLPNSEITPEIMAEFERSKKLPKSSFSNVG